MTHRYVEIRSTDAVERVPLDDLDDLRAILAERGSYVHYAIHSKWWYGLIPHGKGKTIYSPQISSRAGDPH